MSITKDTKKP